MARQGDGPDGDAVNTDCPLHGRARTGTAIDDPRGDQAPEREQVDWAGLPVNLDLVFSQEKCDKVYVQHLLRKRETRLWRWLHDGAPPCACEIATDHERLDPNAAESMSSR